MQMKNKHLFILLLFLSQYRVIIAQTAIIDSLKYGLEKSKNDTSRINFLNELSWEYVDVNKIEDAIKCGENALNLAIKIKFDKGIATANARLGNVYYTISEFEKALEHHLKALELKEKLGDRKGMAATYQNIGNIYQMQTNSKKAITYYLLSLKIKEEIGDKKGIGNSLNSIGNIYKDQNNFKKALNYYKQSLVVREEINDLMGIGYSLSNIATIYGMQKDYIHTLEYATKALNILEQTGNKNGIAACLGIIANVYKAEKNYTLAQKYNFKALEISEEIDNKYTIAMCLVNIGNIYFLDKKNQEGIDYLNKGLAVAKEIGAKDYVKGTYYNLAEVYEQMNNHKKALEYYKQYSELKDSIINDETNKELAEKTALYNNEKKEREISILKAEKEKQELLNTEEKEQQKIVIIAISAFFSLGIFFFIYVLYAYKKKKIANDVLTRQKLVIEQKNNENETLLAEIHHRVKNNLQVISSLLSLQGKSIEDESIRLAIEDGKQRVKSMELVHKMLYEGNHFSSIEINEYIQKLVHHLANAFGIDESKFFIHINSKTIKLDIDTAVPIALILNELIINSFKYAYSETRILQLNISIEEHGNELKIIFSDNGTIANTSKISNSKSFGSKLIQLLCKQLNGKMEIKNDNGLCYLFSINEYKIVD